MIGPAWTRGEIEAPLGRKDVGTAVYAFYTEEQRARLGVDEQGNKVPVPDARAPAWTRGEIEAPAGEKKEDGAVLGVYTEEQQKRLNVNEWGESVEPKEVVPDARAPAWTRGEIEAPAGEKKEDGAVLGVYTEEQQKRLNVNEWGESVEPKVAVPDARAPAWTRGEIEAPAGEKKEDGAVLGVYTEEQQKRLNVNEWGESVEPKEVVPDARAPAWTRGEIEAPAGEKKEDGAVLGVYTEEQQKRLNVNEWGESVEPEPKGSIMRIVGGQDLRPVWMKNNLEAPLGTKNMGTWKAAVFTGEQMARLKITQDGDSTE